MIAEVQQSFAGLRVHILHACMQAALLVCCLSWYDSIAFYTVACSMAVYATLSGIFADHTLQLAIAKYMV